MYLQKFITKNIFIVILIVFSQLQSQRTLTVGGTNWTVTIPSITEAGDNYAGTYESSTSQIIWLQAFPYC
jgi:hypothetical protein